MDFKTTGVYPSNQITINKILWLAILKMAFISETRFVTLALLGFVIENTMTIALNTAVLT